MQRQSSDESYSSATSPETHRRSSSSSFNGMSYLAFGSSDSNISSKSSPSPTKAHSPLSVSAHSPLSVSWSSDTIASSSESKMPRRKTVCGGETGFCAFELIRQLSFCPIQETKKRADTAETEVGSSFDSVSSDRHPIGLDLDFDMELDFDVDLDMDLKEAHSLRRSPSPLLGLKYLPEEDMFI